MSLSGSDRLYLPHEDRLPGAAGVRISKLADETVERLADQLHTLKHTGYIAIGFRQNELPKNFEADEAAKYIGKFLSSWLLESLHLPEGVEKQEPLANTVTLHPEYSLSEGRSQLQIVHPELWQSIQAQGVTSNDVLLVFTGPGHGPFLPSTQSIEHDLAMLDQDGLFN